MSSELSVCYGHDGRIELFAGESVDNLYPVYLSDYFGTCPRVIHGQIYIVFFECPVYVDDFRVPDVRAVFLEREAHYDYFRFEHLYALFQHQLDGLIGYVCPHSIVYSSSCQYDFRVVPVSLCALGQIIRVYGYAVPSYKPRIHLYEVPFRGCGIKYLQRVYPHEGEYLGELVYECDIYVPLAVFYHLRRFSHLYRGRAVSAVFQDFVVDPVDQICGFRRGPGCYLEYVFHRVLLVSGIHSFGGVPGEKSGIQFQSGNFFDDRYADFLGDSGIYGGFIDRYVAFAYDGPDCPACPDERGEVRIVVYVHRRRYRHDVEIALPYVVRV